MPTSQSAVAATIVEHRGLLLVELRLRRSTPKKVLTELDRGFRGAGHLVLNTQFNLGVSPEALKLLKSVRKGPRALGEISWFSDPENYDCFGWLGAACQVLRPERLSASSLWAIGAHQVIANTVSAEVQQAFMAHAQ